MKWRSLAIVAAVGVLTLGCDKIPFLGNKGDDAAQPEAAPDTTPAPAPAPQPAPEPVQPEPDPVPVQVQASTGPLEEEPWFPRQTGTVQPGMTGDEVVAVWGPPVADRTVGNWTFLYFRNGCELACGTFDVVMLEGGQVVDAIVRASEHTYGGMSSSPADRAGEFTPPEFSADTLRVIG